MRDAEIFISKKKKKKKKLVESLHIAKKSQFSKAKIFDKPKKYDQKLKKTKVELVLCII